MSGIDLIGLQTDYVLVSMPAEPQGSDLNGLGGEQRHANVGETCIFLCTRFMTCHSNSRPW